MIDTPKNLTRNILLGMLLGFVVGAIFYYLEIFPQGVKNFVSMYIFNLGCSIFINLLKMLIIPLVFFSLVSGISSLTSMKSLGNIYSGFWTLRDLSGGRVSPGPTCEERIPKQLANVIWIPTGS